MLFSSAEFLLVFLPIVLLVYYAALRWTRLGQNLFLTLASLFFYAWGEWRFLPVMLLSILMNYGFGIWIGLWRKKKHKYHKYFKYLVAWAAGCNLALLFIFKYLIFTVETLNYLGASLTVPIIRLPIGISFFTFQAMSYVLDVAKGKTKPQLSPLSLGLYISFFPQLIAGPIVKYTTVADQIDHRKETWADFSAGCSRFLTGLGKKVLLANQLAIVADHVFSTRPGDLSTAMAWLGSLCYTLQIYYDFSGYSDMAIGLGRMFGFRFLENFNYPYAAHSITDFWRRWHISLSTWFRDYVYIPLGGNRVPREKHIRNLFIVWFLTGLWHGADWSFVAWGLFYFLFLVLEKYYKLGKKWPGPIQRLYTLLVVNFLWMLFRADSLAYAWQFFLTMLGGGTEGPDPLCSLYFREYSLILLAALLFSFPIAKKLDAKLSAFRPKGRDLTPLWDVLYAAGLLAVAVASVCYLVKGTYNPFIYFRF